MASPAGNQDCASCISTLSFRIVGLRAFSNAIVVQYWKRSLELVTAERSNS